MTCECMAALLGRNWAAEGFLKVIGVVKGNLNSFVGVYRLTLCFPVLNFGVNDDILTENREFLYTAT